MDVRTTEAGTAVLVFGLVVMAYPDVLSSSAVDGPMQMTPLMNEG